MTASVFFLAVGSGASVVGGMLSYLASRHQRLLVARPAAGPCLTGAAVATCVALGCLLQVRGPATAVFMVVLLLMAVWSIVPAMVAFLMQREGRR
ncbi:hypothetical protein HLH44_01025 [Gluconacetobacter sp. 1c LMG 22058]|uniref:Uncharacterized protein n=1 Tax=Gluconacetobacter dulcium TaxID=2729096 RepID=A0A7W4JWI0_9PROT|nr:hypothetical protein [Gluconacetobacter dulcium]MBB2196056.1 hypothetical protein [Gluconacetobacter dulcium]